MTLTQEQFEILDHTLYRAARRCFCGNDDDPDMSFLVDQGLMRKLGKGWVPGESYFTITPDGEAAHTSHRLLDSQSSPPSSPEPSPQSHHPQSSPKPFPESSRQP